MLRTQSNTITERQKYWLEHIKSCGKNQTMKSYAAKQGLSLSAFYDWKSLLKRRGLLDEPVTPVFQRAFVNPQKRFYPDCRIETPSGVVIELRHDCEPGFIKTVVEIVGEVF